MAEDKDSDGVWRTICGRKVFIKKGQKLTDAMRESGKFKKENDDGKNAALAKATTGKDEPSKQFGGRTAKEFAGKLKAAKATVPPTSAWRVTAHTQEELDAEYPGAKLHVTEGGSTVAVTKDGDIISVCKKFGDGTSGKQLMADAVAHGGKKLDSYAGNHGFYLKCGFEPVSWCEWNDDYTPEDWSEMRDEREPIIFYRYTGKTSTVTAKGFCAKVKASADYDAAQQYRNKHLEEKENE